MLGGKPASEDAAEQVRAAGRVAGARRSGRAARGTTFHGPATVVTGDRRRGDHVGPA